MAPTNQHASVLIRTKLARPTVRPGLVQRPRLLERLDETLEHRLMLVSAPPGLGKTTLCREIIDRHVPEHTSLLSRPLWDELVEKLNDKFNLEIDARPVLTLYRRHATWTDPPPLDRPVSRDPDDWVLATSVAGEAEVIVTGDDDLLSLDEYEGISILTPPQLIERLQSG